MKNDWCPHGFGWPFRLFCLAFILVAPASTGFSAQSLPLPSRAAGAPGASALFAQLSSLSQEEREKAIAAQVLSGNIPDFLRRFCEVTISNTVGSSTNRATFFALPDY